MAGGRGMGRHALGVGGGRGGFGRLNNEDGPPPGQHTLRELLAVLHPYFWPAGLSNRVRAVSCFAALGASKVCSLLYPLFIGMATDSLLAGELPLGAILAASGLRFASGAFDELQKLLYQRVKETAYFEISVRTFSHVHSLSPSWHASKRIGVVIRSMDRGNSAASTVVDMLFLRLGPTVLELLAMVVIFATAYGSWPAAVVLLSSFIVYFAVTVGVTNCRKLVRRVAVKTENEAAAVLSDSLVGFDTVKAFGNEVFEATRYGDAVKSNQAATRQHRAALVAMNISQNAIQRLAVVGIMIISAREVLAGTGTVGDFVATCVWGWGGLFRRAAGGGNPR